MIFRYITWAIMDAEKILIFRTWNAWFTDEKFHPFGTEKESDMFYFHIFPPSSVTQGSGKMQSGLSFSDSDVSFTPLVVLELADDTKTEAIAWLLNRIRDKQQNGGETPDMLNPGIQTDRSWTLCENTGFMRFKVQDFVLCASVNVWNSQVGTQNLTFCLSENNKHFLFVITFYLFLVHIR